MSPEFAMTSEFMPLDAGVLRRRSRARRLRSCGLRSAGLDALAKEQLAEAIGVSRPTVSQYEHGEMRLDLDTLERAAHHLGVRAGWLAFGELPREA